MISPPSNSLLSRRQIFLIAGGIFILIVIFTLHRPTALPINQGHNHAPVMTGTSPADLQTQAQKEGSEVDGDYPFPTVTVTVTASTAAEATGVSAAGVGGGSGEVDGWKNPLAMTRRECVAEFPGLFQELERVVRLREGRKIKQSDLDSHYLRTFEGYTRVLIYENQVRIPNPWKFPSPKAPKLMIIPPQALCHRIPSGAKILPPPFLPPRPRPRHPLLPPQAPKYRIQPQYLGQSQH